MADLTETPSSKSVLTTGLGTEPFVCRMKTFDALSQPFRYDLDVVTAGPAIDPGKLLGKTIALHLKGEADSVRHFHGHVVEFTKLFNHPTQVSRRPVYRCVLRPWLWLLSLRTNCRVFHDTSAVDIVKTICAEHGFGNLIDNALTSAYQPYAYCVQYNETDFAFVSRLLEREGIYYYFAHSESDHKLVLVDDPEHHQLKPENTDIPARYLEGFYKHRINSWNETNTLRPRAYMLDDYDYLMPTKNIQVKLQTEEPYSYTKGTHFEYPGGYTEASAGQNYVKYHMHAYNARAAYVTGTGNVLGLSSGSAFTTPWASGEHLIVRIEADFFFGDFEAIGPLPERQPFETTAAEITCAFTAMVKAKPFRPERITPTPVIRGMQTAKVVAIDPHARAGSIDTDEHGRVMVEFPWTDRHGATEAATPQRSCWLRVAQAWAGNAWGMQFIPRVGGEVVVGFIDGDPDRPIIVGSVYNGLWRAPFALPGAMVSGLKTDRNVNGVAAEATATVEAHGASEPNQLAFDDGKGKISMKSQKIGVVAKDTVQLQGASIGIAAGVAKVDISELQESISLFCPSVLTLQTPTAKIELSERGVVILGRLTVNEEDYPLPPTPAGLEAAAAELAESAAKVMTTGLTQDIADT